MNLLRRLRLVSAHAAMSTLALTAAVVAVTWPARDAHAAGGTLTTVVVPLSTSVTYSVPGSEPSRRVGGTPDLATSIAWRVTVANTGSNTINKVWVRGQSAIVAGAAALPQPYLFDGIASTACTTDTAGGFLCDLGTLRSQVTTSFVVFYGAPTDPGAPSVASLSGTTIYAEGLNDSPSSPNNSRVSWPDLAGGDPSTAVDLGTDNPTNVATAVPPTGAVVFTGRGGIGTPANPLATTVEIPAAAASTTAKLAVAPTTANCLNSFVTCLRTDVTVPGRYSPFLTFTLRQHRDNIKRNVSIDSVLIYYESSTVGGYTGFIGACAAPDRPTVDASGRAVPCIAGRTFIRNSKDDRLKGSFEFRIISVENGGFTML